MKEKDNQNRKKFMQKKIATGKLSLHIQTTHKAQLKKKSSKILAQDLNAHFSTEGIEMAMKHKKRFSASLVLRERQINCPMNQNDHLGI